MKERVETTAVMNRSLSHKEIHEKIISQLNAIFDASQDGLYLTDGEGYTLRVNSAYEKMTGYKREDLVGKHMSWLVQEGMISESVSLQVLTEQKIVSRLQTIGKGKNIMVTGIPIKDENGKIIMVVNNARDISYLKKLEEDLEKARRLSEKFSEEIAYSHPSEPEFIFQSEQMKSLITSMRHIARYPTSILLRGESGVGKEVIANVIHKYSRRSKKPFIKVNCAAIPETLLEAELFGYEKGAFSGAHTLGKPGLFELANEGTILLDEIGDLPINLQGKLLRVIQERELRRVGGVKSISLDIRILSATNRDLKQLVKRGEFREDLYYRLNVVDIFIPPLRARREDIQPLIFYYLNKYCKEYRVEKHISEETIGYLEGYPWPGNIREVRNLIENLIVSTINCEIKPFHLPVYIKEPSTGYHCEKQQIASQQNIEEMPGLRETLEQLEKKLITEALQKQGSIRKAATLLKIDHSTLIRKMKKYNVDKM